MALLRYAAKFDPFLSLDCTPTPSTLAQSKERKGSNFAIWQPCPKALVTTGAWSEYTISNQVEGARYYYRDIWSMTWFWNDLSLVLSLSD